MEKQTMWKKAKMVLIEQEYEKMLKNEKKKQKKQKTIRIASKQDYGNGEITGN